jgi:elongation factor Tu
LLARQIGVPSVVVALSKTDKVEDEEILELVELEVRELLTEYEFPGDDVPVVRVSALRALEGDEEWKAQVMELLDACDQFIPEPTPNVDKPFLMVIEDVSTATGRGTAVTGRIDRGVVHPGDEVELVGARIAMRGIVSGIEMPAGATVDEAHAGGTTRLLLTDLMPQDLERGMAVAAPGTVTHHDVFMAALYVLRSDEGGPSGGLSPGAGLLARFRTTETDVAALEPGPADPQVPGDPVSEMQITLSSPIPMEQGQRFSVREHGRTVALGVVTALTSADRQNLR